jgi:hypothetical protein
VNDPDWQWGAANTQMDGTWYHIPGPNGAPVMSFRASDGVDIFPPYEIEAYYHVYDHLGNLKSTWPFRELNAGDYRFSNIKNEMYLPFGGSITAGYSVNYFHQQEKIFVTENARGQNSYRASTDTYLNYPKKVGFGFAGAPRDLLGNVYVGGKAYSTVEGVVLRDGFENEDGVCSSAPSALIRAEAHLAERMKRDQFNVSDYAKPLITKRVNEAQAFADYIDGLARPSFKNLIPIIGAYNAIRYLGSEVYPKESAEAFFESRGTKDMMLAHTSDLRNSSVSEAFENAGEGWVFGVTDFFKAGASGGPGEMSLATFGLIPVIGKLAKVGKSKKVSAALLKRIHEAKNLRRLKSPDRWGHFQKSYEMAVKSGYIKVPKAGQAYSHEEMRLMALFAGQRYKKYPVLYRWSDSDLRVVKHNKGFHPRADSPPGSPMDHQRSTGGNFTSTTIDPKLSYNRAYRYILRNAWGFDIRGMHPGFDWEQEIITGGIDLENIVARSWRDDVDNFSELITKERWDSVVAGPRKSLDHLYGAIGVPKFEDLKTDPLIQELLEDKKKLDKLNGPL